VKSSFYHLEIGFFGKIGFFSHEEAWWVEHVPERSCAIAILTLLSYFKAKKNLTGFENLSGL
jgi:hypothetical protein